MKRANPDPTCDVCGRDPLRMNSAVAECSHGECPHRRRRAESADRHGEWSDYVGIDRGEIEQRFDKVWHDR